VASGAPVYFSDFMNAALDYPDMRKLILPIVNLNTFHRASLINTIVMNIQLASGPQQVIDFLNALKDDTIAQKAKELLSK